AGGKQMFKLNLSSPGTAALTITPTEVVSSLALDPTSHTVWVSGGQSLFHYDAAGNLTTTIALRPDKINQPTDLPFHFVTQSRWRGCVGGSRRVSSRGSYVTMVPAKTQVDAVGKTLVGLPVPIVRLVAPNPGSVTSNARPAIQLGYDALCGGASCGFSGSYFADYRLSA